MSRSGYRVPAWEIMSLVVSLFALNPMVVDDAAAVILEATPSVRIGEGWNSNVFNAGEDTVDSFGTTLTPALSLRFFTGETSIVRLYGSYGSVWYNSSEAKGAEYSTFNFRLDSPEGVKFSPNWSLNPSVYYINTTDSVSRIQLLPSGDPVLPPVTITNYGKTRTEDFGGAVLVHYQATPNWRFGLNGHYSVLGFSGPDSSTRIGGIATVSNRFTPRTRLGLVAAGNRQTYPNQPDSETLSGGIDYEFQLSPSFNFDLTVGVSYIRQNAGAGGTESSDTAPSGLFHLSYAAETVTATLYGSALYSGYGYGEPTRQGTIGLNLTGRFSMDWSWNLSGSYQISKAVFGPNSDYLHAMYGSAGVRYRPWAWGSLDLSGHWDHQTSGTQTGSGLDTYYFVLGLTVEKPYIVF